MTRYPLTRAFRLDEFEGKPLIALVGGGGKSTTMFTLAAELAAQGRRVVTTTTTRLFASQRAESPAWCAVGDEARLTELLDEWGQCLVTAPDDSWAEGKARGLPVEQVEALLARENVDAVLVEADGSRVRSFKAPAEHEPVIPGSATHVVALVGADIFGKPLLAEHVHRPERVATLGGVPLASPVTPDVVARVLTHPHGVLLRTPGAARFLPFLNKVEDPADAMGADACASLLLANERVHEVVVGSLHTLRDVLGAGEAVPDRAGAEAVLRAPLSRRSRAAGIVLAAGMSTRFGGTKQLLDWRGRSLVAHVAEIALEVCDTVLIVAGHEAEQVARAVDHLPVEVVYNERFAEGQGTSVAAGANVIAETARPFTGELFFLLADQPLITPELLRELRAERGLKRIAVPRHGGKRGNPVLFDAALLPRLRAIRGDTGGRALFEEFRDDIAWVDVDSAAILLDIDTREEWEEVQALQ